MGRVLAKLRHLAAALWWSLKGRGTRESERLAQMHRALALPGRCARVRTNAAWQAAGVVDVSVVVTCFNYAGYVEEAVRSVFAAESGGLTFELVVVDDASSDESPRRLRALLEVAPLPMRIVRPWWNVGLSRARNVGLLHARGEFVFILDADNFIEPDALRRLCRLARDRRADAAYGPLRTVAVDGTALGWLSDRPFDPAYLRGHGSYIDAMALFRSNALRRIGGYDVRLLEVIGGWEDYAVWLRLAAQDAVVAFDPAPVGVYRVKPDSMVRRIPAVEFAQAMARFRACKLR